MPFATITDWRFGPMGPGWMMLFPRNAEVWYDGGPMEVDDLMEEDKLKRGVEEADAEMMGLIVLMLRCRC